jgi:DHA1 family bicyclomycin/chloramphenicol resistance-like MFS transporter
MESKRDLRTLSLLILFTVSGILAMQVISPALPTIAEEFGVTAGAAQLTLTVFFVGYAVFQLIYGPASDRLGRRPVLLFGLLIYAIASIAASFAPTIELLILGRFGQAIGSCVIIVLGNAIARDVYGAKGSIQIIAYIAMAAGIASAAAPYIGSGLLALYGWQGGMFLTAIIATITLVIVFFMFRESLPPERRTTHSILSMNGYGTLLRDPLYLGYAGSTAFVNGAFFAFFSGSPFVVITLLGFSPADFGLFAVIVVGGFLIGATFAPRLARRYGSVAIIFAGALIGLLAGIFVVLTILTGKFELYGFGAAVFLLGFGNGFVIPNAVAACVSLRPEIAGSASAFTGSSQMAMGAIGSVLVAALHDGTPLPLAAVMAGMSLFAVLSVGLIYLKQPRAAEVEA